MRTTSPADRPIPRWLHFVLISDRAGSSWYIGPGSSSRRCLCCCRRGRPSPPSPGWSSAIAGLWLGLLGIAMATGLAMAMRSNVEIPEDYWRSLVDYPVR